MHFQTTCRERQVRFMAKHKPDSSVIPFRVSVSFERKLCRHGALIECRCVNCGFRFIGSVTHKLATIACIHVIECAKKQPKRVTLNAVTEISNLKIRKAHA
jgi:hypothetical protein